MEVTIESETQKCAELSIEANKLFNRLRAVSLQSPDWWDANDRWTKVNLEMHGHQMAAALLMISALQERVRRLEEKQAGAG